MSHHLTPEEADELVSAYVDGEATPVEAALVEADATLLARVEVFRTAARLVASPVEAGSPDAVDDAVARARRSMLGEPPKRRRVGWVAPVAAAAVVLLAL